MVVYNDQTAEILCLWILPGIILLILICLLLKLAWIQSKLTPKDFEVEIVIPYAQHINPRMTIKNIHKPEYLKGIIPSDDQEALKGVLRIDPFKMTCAYIFLGRPPNRHELLFWFDSYGPQFVTGILQGVLIILTL